CSGGTVTNHQESVRASHCHRGAVNSICTAPSLTEGSDTPGDDEPPGHAVARGFVVRTSVGGARRRTRVGGRPAAAGAATRPVPATALAVALARRRALAAGAVRRSGVAPRRRRPLRARRTRAALAAAGTLSALAAGPPGARPTGPLAGLAEVLELLGVEARQVLRRLRQSALGALRDAQVGVQVRRGGVGLDRLGEADVEGLVDERPARHVVPVHEGDGGAGVARATGAAHAVQVR